MELTVLNLGRQWLMPVSSGSCPTRRLTIHQ